MLNYYEKAKKMSSTNFIEVSIITSDMIKLNKI